MPTLTLTQRRGIAPRSSQAITSNAPPANISQLSFADQMVYELRSSSPPSTECITTLYLMRDDQFMVEILRMQSQYLKSPSRPRSQPPNQWTGSDVSAISQNTKHPWHSKVKFAFDFANKIRAANGFSIDPWPIPEPTLTPPTWHSRRRLVWSLNDQEIIAAKNLFDRFCTEGLVPHNVRADGGIGAAIDTFDPSSEEVIFCGA